jgi:major membrane immunogen (membrane-anchored lipoprotein)
MVFASYVYICYLMLIPDLKIHSMSVKKPKLLTVLRAVFLLTGLCLSCSSRQESDLDLIKKFKPEDKYFKSTLVSLHFMLETSPVEEVDTLFRQMIALYDLPVNAEEVKDGTYTGSSPYDAFDYRHVVKIRIEGGKIVEVDYNELLQDGLGKQEDEAYCEEMSVGGTTPAIAYPSMEQQLLATQDLMEVDAVSGATYSLYRFRYAVMIALMKALVD